MITIAQITAFANRLKEATDLNHIILVTTESELTKKMQSVKSEQFPILVVVIPSYDATGGRDNIGMMAQMIMFVLKKDRAQGATETNQMADMEETLAITNAITGILLNGFTDYTDYIFYEGIQPASIHIDPEYNYLGCNGWSLGFNIKN
jgi:hypothetical protein